MLKKVIIELEPEEQIWLERVVLDDSKEEALKMIKEALYPKLQKELKKVHCMPAFEIDARKRDEAKEDNPWLKKEPGK